MHCRGGGDGGGGAGGSDCTVVVVTVVAVTVEMVVEGGRGEKVVGGVPPSVDGTHAGRSLSSMMIRPTKFRFVSLRPLAREPLFITIEFVRASNYDGAKPNRGPLSTFLLHPPFTKQGIPFFVYRFLAFVIKTPPTNAHKSTTVTYTLMLL